MKNLEDDRTDLTPLFDAILTHVPETPDHSDKPFRMQIANLAYDEYV